MKLEPTTTRRGPEVLIARGGRKVNSDEQGGAPRCIKLVHVSDTHNRFYDIPAGDILVHSGDFTDHGVEGEHGDRRGGNTTSGSPPPNMSEIGPFLEWWDSMDRQFRYKVLVPGNHEYGLDKLSREERNALLHCDGVRSFCLVDEGATVMGLRFYGSPWTNCCMAWHATLDERTEILSSVPGRQPLKKKTAASASTPEAVDVLVTHAPPYRIMDANFGCKALARAVAERVQPSLHCFGHVHAGNGIRVPIMRPNRGTSLVAYPPTTSGTKTEEDNEETPSGFVISEGTVYSNAALDDHCVVNVFALHLQ